MFPPQYQLLRPADIENNKIDRLLPETLRHSAFFTAALEPAALHFVRTELVFQQFARLKRPVIQNRVAIFKCGAKSSQIAKLDAFNAANPGKPLQEIDGSGGALPSFGDLAEI